MSAAKEAGGTVYKIHAGGWKNLSRIIFARFILLFSADLFGQFHDFKSVLLLSLRQDFLVDGIVDAHAHQADEPDDDAQHEGNWAAASDHVHGQTHANTGDQGAENAGGVGEYRCRQFGFGVQLPQCDDLGIVLRRIFVCEMFGVNLISVHGLYLLDLMVLFYQNQGGGGTTQRAFSVELKANTATFLYSL